MSKSHFAFIALVILTIACGFGGAAEWQDTSKIPPATDANLPDFLIHRQKGGSWPPEYELISLDMKSGAQSSQPLFRETYEPAVFSETYRVLGNMIVTESGSFYEITEGVTSPNGVWQVLTENEALKLKRVDKPGRLDLSTKGNMPHSPVWSADGEWLAFRDDDGLWIVPMRDLNKLKLDASPLEPLSWSADNRQLLLRDGATVVILNLETQARQNLSNVDGEQIHGQPVWAPDGRTIYTLYGSNGEMDISTAHYQPVKTLAGLAAISTEGRVRYLLPNGRGQGVTVFFPSPDGSALAARHIRCANKQSGLFPFMSTYQCEGSLVVVETATGNYATPARGYLLEPALGWNQPRDAVNLGNFPTP